MALVLDVTIAVLLMLTIVYCWKLNRRIGSLQKDKKSLAEFIRNFDRSIVRAEANIADLKDLSQKSAHQMDEKNKKAQMLIDDMAFLSERCTKISDNLEKLVSQARKQDTVSMVPTINHQASRKKPVQPIDHIEKNPKNEKRQSIETLLQRISERSEFQNTPGQAANRNEGIEQKQENSKTITISQSEEKQRQRTEALMKILNISKKKKIQG